MGKKDKRRQLDSNIDNQDPKKQKIHETESSNNRPKAITIRTQNIPSSHKEKFYLDDGTGTEAKYIQLLSWLRSMSSFDGHKFDGIPNTNWAGNGCPVLEVEIVSPTHRSAKFILTKMNLYTVGFYTQKSWYHFDGQEYKIEGANLLLSFDGRYTNKPWERVGPYSMIKALKALAKTSPIDHGKLVAACEVFYVHLCEAARYYPIQTMICRTLKPEPSQNQHSPEGGGMMGFDLEGGDSADLLDLVRAEPINFKRKVRTPDFFGSLIHNYANISKVWYTYYFSEKVETEMTVTALKSDMKSMKSVGSTIAVLCNSNLRKKVLMELEKKSKNAGSRVTPEQYESMKMEVEELILQKKVQVPINDKNDEEAVIIAGSDSWYLA